MWGYNSGKMKEYLNKEHFVSSKSGLISLIPFIDSEVYIRSASDNPLIQSYYFRINIYFLEYVGLLHPCPLLLSVSVKDKY